MSFVGETFTCNGSPGTLAVLPSYIPRCVWTITPACTWNQTLGGETCYSPNCEVNNDGQTSSEGGYDLSCICGSSSVTSCAPPAEYSQCKVAYDYWLNSTCGNVPGQAGLAPNWAEQDKVATTTTGLTPVNTMTSSVALPDCASCNNTVNDVVDNCVWYSCELGVDSTTCSPSWFSVPDFCTQFVQLRASTLTAGCPCHCSEFYISVLEQWSSTVDSLCSSTAGWQGSTDLWLTNTDPLDLPPVWQFLIPASWAVQPQVNISLLHDPVLDSCAKPAVTLVVYGVINLVVGLIAIALSRRTVVYWLTCKCCGHRYSKMWLVTGPLAAGAQIMFNVLNAVVVQRQPAFSVDIASLVLLWCTRPRFALLVLLGLSSNAQAEYWSATASAMVGEILLQMVSLYVFVVVAKNYSINAAYGPGSVLPYGAAQAVPAGMFMWMVLLPFAMLAMVWKLITIFHSGKVNKRTQHGASVLLDQLATMERILPAQMSLWRRQSQREFLSIDGYAWPPTEEEWTALRADCLRLREVVDTMTTALPEKSVREKLASEVRKMVKKNARADSPNDDVARCFSHDSGPSKQSLRLPSWIWRGQIIRIERDPVGRESAGWAVTMKNEQAEVQISAVGGASTWRRDDETVALAGLRDELSKVAVKVEKELRAGGPRTISDMLGFTPIIMLMIWAAQWTWWIGFVALMDTSYCLPKIEILALNWIISSVSGR